MMSDVSTISKFPSKKSISQKTEAISTAFSKLVNRIRCVVHIALLFLLAPFSVAYICFMSYWDTAASEDATSSKSKSTNNSKKAPSAEKKEQDTITVLITGGKMSKSLQLARAVKRADSGRVKVLLVETHKYKYSGSRFSNFVDYFETVADPCRSEEGRLQYHRDLTALCVKYNVSVFLPVSSPAASVHDSDFALRFQNAHNITSTDSTSSKTSENNKALAMSLTPELCRILDNKESFAVFCRTCGDLPGVLDSYLVKSDAEAHALNKQLQPAQSSYVLKNLEYDPVHRLDLFKLPCSEPALQQYLDKIRRDGNGLSEDRPWQLQEAVDAGDEYTVAFLVRSGKLKVLTVSESSASQLNYEHISFPAIEDWVAKFCTHLPEDTNALLCMDFMTAGSQNNSSKNKKPCVIVHPLECNPRVHSQFCVLGSVEMQEKFGKAILGDLVLADGNHVDCLKPSTTEDDGQKKCFFLINEMLKLVPTPIQSIFGFKYQPSSSVANLVDLLKTQKDADWDREDKWALFFRNHVQLVALLVDTFKSGCQWHKCDFCIGKVVEVGGD